MLYVSNAFALSMLPPGEHLIRVSPLSATQARAVLTAAEEIDEMVSAIGHADTARLVSDDLGAELMANRVNLTLTSADVLLVAQYLGPRLPEGTTELPAGARIEYRVVQLDGDVAVG